MTTRHGRFGFLELGGVFFVWLTAASGALRMVKGYSALAPISASFCGRTIDSLRIPVVGADDLGVRDISVSA